MANTENIEAKLCAYVDGELDAAGRAEIEAHLVANPQHRQLIEELRQQRGLLGDLPRESAPADLMESVQNQLERSALLDQGRTSDIAGRISNWPKMMSVAAVLIMAIGLFAVIYYVLPRNTERPREYASSEEPADESAATQPEVEPATSPTGNFVAGATGRDKDAADTFKAAGERDREARRSDAVAPGAVAMTPSAAPAPALVPSTQLDVFAKGGPVESKDAAGKGYTNIFADAETEEKIKRSSAPTGSLVMVVASADPSQAQGEVQKYLEENKIHWEPVSEPVPQWDIKESQVMRGSRLGNTQARLKSGAGGGFGAGGGAAKKEDSFTLNKQVASDSKATTEPDSESQQKQQELPQQIAQAPAALPPPAASTPNVASNAASPKYDLGATTAPAQQPAEKPADQLALQSQSQGEQGQQQQPQANLQVQGGQQQQQQQSPPQLIVARGLTRRQVTALNSSLSTQNAGQVYNYRCSGDSITPTTLPSDAADVENLSGMAAPLARAESAAAATQPAAAKREIAAKTKSDDGLSAMPAPAATTQPEKTRAYDTLNRERASEDLAKLNSPGTQPSVVTAAIPTTAPSGAAGPSTHPADDRLDVVICIQPPAPAPVPGIGQNLNAAPTIPASQAAEEPAPNAAATAPPTTAHPTTAPATTAPTQEP